MLSILIPVYDYHAFPLAAELHQQCVALHIPFEILCQDDASTTCITENQAINTLENGTFSSNVFNLGRGRNCNALAEKATYDWLLILDCDTFPKNADFIKNYLQFIQNQSGTVAFGGIVYQPERPTEKNLLRWVYGTARESLSVEKRNANPNGNALTSNLLIRKEVFSSNPFDESITKYGYEDLVFLFHLKKKGIIVKHIDNPIYHLGLETSLQFLEKTKTALENLKSITKTIPLDQSESKILRTYSFFKRFYLVSIISFLFKKTEPKITTNLLTQEPSLLLFDLYKLGYYCSI
nr:glycosyltransferase [uncultured Flavobacterium sp.]